MASNNEAKVIFKAETSEFDSNLKSAQSELSSLRAELKLNEAEFQNTGDANEYLTNKLNLLQQELQANHDKQDALNEKIEVAKQVYGENSEEVQKLERQLTNAKTEEQNLMSQVNDTNDSLNGQTQAVEESGSAVDNMASCIANAGIADMIKEIADATMDMAQQFDEAQAAVVQGTGATGDALDELNESARNAYASLADKDATLTGVSEILAELSTRFGVTGDEATDLTAKISTFAQHTGTDGVAAVDAIADITKRWGLDIEDVDGLLDDLTTANQACQMSVSELTGYLTKNSTQFQELGYSTEEALAMLISLSDGGANVSTIMSALTKAVSNLSEVTDDVPGTFQQAIEAMAECETVSEALQAEVGDTGLTIEDVFGTKAAQELATNVQNGSFAVADWTAVLEENDGVLMQTAEDATTMQDSWSQACNNMQLALSTTLSPSISDVVSKIAGIVTQIAQVIQNSDALQGVITGVAAALGVLAAALAISSTISAVEKAFSMLNTTMLANPITAIVALIAGLVTAFIYLWNNCDEFREFWLNLWDTIKEKIDVVVGFISEKIDALKEFFGGLQEKVSDVKDNITNSFETMKNNIATKMDSIKNNVSDKFTAVRDTMNTLMGEAKDLVQGKLDNIMEAYEENGGGLKGIASATMQGIKEYYTLGYDALNTLTNGQLDEIKNKFQDKLGTAFDIVKDKLDAIQQKFTDIMDNVKETVSNAIEKVKGFFNFEWSLPEIKLPHFSIEGNFSLNPPSAPHFSVDWYAKGGILDAPTIFGFDQGGHMMGGGEAGQEAVLPIDLLRDYIREEIEASIGNITITEDINYDKLAEAMANQKISVIISEREFGRLVREVS